MTDTSHITFVDTVAEARAGAPHIAGTAVALTQHNYTQEEVARGLTSFAEPAFDRFAQSSGVERRSLAMPLDRYAEMSGFTEANAAYLEVATELGEQAVRAALEAANVDPKEVDAIVTVSSTGVAVPTIDARMSSRLGLRPDVKRIPLFGLGCVAGAAGLARVHDYLRGFPGHVAVLLSVELCSLTLQRDDTSIPALIGLCLFGDGAAAVVATGADRIPTGTARMNRGPRVLATRSTLFPDTVDVMGWNVSSDGFRLVMSRDVPRMADDYLGGEVDRIPRSATASTTDDVSTWICHPGGPKVLEAVGHALELAVGGVPAQLGFDAGQRQHLLGVGAGRAEPNPCRPSRPPGRSGVMLAMGPGFSFELLLLSW